jgi:hypothetical protein
MTDDKGNKIYNNSIVTDTGDATTTYQPEPVYYYVVDKDHCVRIGGIDRKVMTLEQLKSNGYIKVYSNPKLVFSMLEEEL